MAGPIVASYGAWPWLVLQAAVTFGLALGLAVYATPLARRAALRFGIVDRPDGRLKTHREPVPYLGGLAVYGAFLVSVALSLTLGFDQRVLGLLLGGSILVIVGLVDDLGSLPYGAKLVGQAVAALVAVRSDIAVQLHYGGGGLGETFLNVAASVFWLVLLTNSVNLVDVMDGLAATISLVATLTLLLVALLNNRLEVLLVTAALAGALLGFLRYNRHPARIYLGDTGALFVGFMLGALCLIGSYTMVNPLGFLSPLCILAIPLGETVFISSLRLARGASPFRGSPDHFALRLRRRGYSVPAIVRRTGVAGLTAGGVGLANLWLDVRSSAILLGLTFAALAAIAVWLARTQMAPSDEASEEEEGRA